ncbi:MAG TPA: 4Fe-4S binding protein [Anaerovoracaceae bacterium]|nr:4Fe-4S binding protein [Anaerovoracaceae bacterium]
MKSLTTILRVLFLGIFLFLVSKGKMMLWLGLYVVSLVAAMFFGRIYCGYACPMNTLMIPTEWIAKKLNLRKYKPPKWLASGKFPWVALVVSVAGMILAKRLLNKNIPVLLIWLGISVLMALIYKPSVFHNLICPFGILQKIFAKFARHSNKVDTRSCIGCKLCEKVCPSDAIAISPLDDKAVIETSACLQCAKCQYVCPENSIHYIKM